MAKNNQNNLMKKRSKSIPATSVPSNSSTSLQQRLKKHRGIAASTSAPPPFQWRSNTPAALSSNNNYFLTTHSDPKAFDECVKLCYAGFYYDAPDDLPTSLHRDFDSAFEGLERGGLFLYDTVQPGKKRLTRTSVTRTLVGDPGSTYKYLGLRLFSHPWVDVDTNGNALPENFSRPIGHTLTSLGYSSQTTSSLIRMGRINSDLIKRSKAKLDKHVAPKVHPSGLVGSAEFNLTLINRMESTAEKRDLKLEPAYGMGKISVGWHKDSGLKDYSTITVFQSLKGVSPISSLSTTTTKTEKKKNKETKMQENEWSVALRAMDGGAGGALSTVPPLLVPLQSGTLYFMLDDFNHNHEHAVIAGSSGIRYSSTHRVAREGAGTWQYIRDKVQSFFDSAVEFDLTRGSFIGNDNMAGRKLKDRLVTHVRAMQNLMTEIEFEWLRQWYVQGEKHAGLHPYWHGPIKSLCNSFCELERMTMDLCGLLHNESKSTANSCLSENLFDVLIESFAERSKQRRLWRQRYQDTIFSILEEDERPFSCSCLDRNYEGRCDGNLLWDGAHMPEDLDELIEIVRKYRSAFVGRDASVDSGSKSSKKRKASLMTKREQKRVASNWERLKSKLGNKS